MISDNYYPKKRNDILQEDLEEGCILYNKKKNEVYTLNISAAFVWEYCDGHNNLEQIAQDLATSCNLKVEDVIDEVRKIIINFQKNSLLIADIR